MQDAAQTYGGGISGAKKGDIIVQRKLHIEKLNHLFSSPNFNLIVLLS
jgi:hypothetical protein